MKIVYLYSSLPEYRKEFFYLLNKQLKERGHILKVLYGVKSSSNESKQIDRDEGFESLPFAIKIVYEKGGLQFTSYPGMFKAFLEEKPDVYVLQFHVAELTYWRIYRYAKHHHIPYITWDCNYQRPELGGLQVRLRSKLVDKTDMEASVCLTYGTKLRDELIRKGRDEKDVIVAQNTINIEKIIAERSPLCDNRDFNHPIHVLFVGLVKGRKYLETAIEAVASLIKEGHDIYFDIVGGGDMFETCKEQIAQLGVNDRIIMHGPKHGEDVKRFFEQSDIFLLPGTGGLAINEAMAYSLPIISTEGDGTIIDLIDGNGYLLNRMGDVDEIKNAVLSFLNLTPTEKQTMANRSKEIILQRATLENMVNKHIEAIERALQKKGLH
jgi:glycosyltransferase involved in cell wall biosynthesis